MAKRILVVEDNALNVKLVRTLRQLEGYKVLVTETGEQAQGEAVRLRPDQILMDIQLPGIDGLEACRRLKRDPRTATIPVVALTSFAMVGDEQKALEAGCAGYLTKPIDTQAFGSAINRFLRSSCPPSLTRSRNASR
jgi:CheY-like chemotaxis protein